MSLGAARLIPEKAAFRPALPLPPVPGLYGADMPRKQISARTRFEVFKRDGFKCVYCGCTQEQSQLHVDHVVPVSRGGTNDVVNLVTACQPCNLGKSHIPLESIPQSLEAVAADMEKRRQAIEKYRQIVEEERQRQEDEIFDIGQSLDYRWNEKMPVSKFNSIKRFVEQLGYLDVMDAAHIACDRFSYPSEKRFKYFCGVCWNLIRRAQEEQEGEGAHA